MTPNFLQRALLFTLFTFKAACAAPLWQGTTSGMSPQEVKKLYPSATEPKQIDGKLIMSLSGVAIFDQKFNTLFYFGSQGLIKVSLQASNIGGKDEFTRDPAVTFKLIRDELVRKYGQPVSSSTEKAQFLSQGTSIELSYMDLRGIGSETQSLNVRYDSNSPGGENPL